MTSFVVKNNAESTVANNPLAQAATTLNVAAGDGGEFPSAFPFLITLWDESTYPDPTDDSGMEIVKCTGRTTDALTIVRAQEGTADVAHALGERVAMLITAGILNDATYGLATKLDGIDTGADVTGSNPPQAHGASVHTDRTRSVWMSSPHHLTGTTGKYGIYLDPDTDQESDYVFIVPTDFVSLNNVYIYYAGQATDGDVVLDLYSYHATIDENVNANNLSDVGNVVTISNLLIHRFTAVGLFAGLAVGDRGVIKVNRDADNVSDDNSGSLTIIGVLVEYTADM